MRPLQTLAAIACALLVPASAFASAGSFHTNDPQLNDIWAASVRTAEDMIAPGPLAVDSAGRPCQISLSIVILDGITRDRCPYVGDEAVIDRTLDASTPRWELQRSMLAWFAGAQHSDGSIPSSPIFGAALVLIDYNAYWIEALHDYVLYSGDVGLARQVWPQLVRLLDGFYVDHTLPSGLLQADGGHFDYAFVPRQGRVVAYYNAQYAFALTQAAELAAWVGSPTRSGAWNERARRLTDAFGGVFWDAQAGAFCDTTTDCTTHPQDGNAFAVLALAGTPAQRRAGLDYLWTHSKQEYGNTISDSQTWDNPAWGWQADLRAYPFISYFEVLARFESGDDASALDLIRREWGYMLRLGPGTMWETIGPYGGGPTDRTPSWDAGWSSGAAPALTRYVLGVNPTSPGFATFTVSPHPDAIETAEGDVPTPHGPIHVFWRQTDDDLILQVDAPPGTTWLNRPLRPRRRRASG
jgi:hypothetical protein